jgi:flagellar biosynthesis chaperone FliJ
MSFNAFGDREDEEEIDLNDLAKMHEKENSIDNIINIKDTIPKNNDIFNSVFTTEIFSSNINNNDEERKLQFFEIQLIQEKINFSLYRIVDVLNKHIYSYKIAFIYKLKCILNKKYSKLVIAELLYLDIKSKINSFIYLIEFIILKKIKKYFNRLKNYSYLKKHFQELEQAIKKEKENKIQNLNNKLNSAENNLVEATKKLNILNNIQKKISNENKSVKNKINQLNDKMNQLIKTGNSLKESISNKKNIYNNANKNYENIIQTLENSIEQKENEKERAMKEVDNFYQSMDGVLSQYESISETILSNCNLNANNN